MKKEYIEHKDKIQRALDSLFGEGIIQLPSGDELLGRVLFHITTNDVKWSLLYCSKCNYNVCYIEDVIDTKHFKNLQIHKSVCFVRRNEEGDWYIASINDKNYNLVAEEILRVRLAGKNLDPLFDL